MTYINGSYILGTIYSDKECIVSFFFVIYSYIVRIMLNSN